jgi:hypothetical protein
MAVIGASPVSFISESTSEAGKQFQIPLPYITITSGVADASAWPQWGSLGTDQGLVTNLLASLVAQGLIAPPPS